MAQVPAYHVLGLDIGFSESRRSSGVLVAESRGGTLFAADGPHNITAADALSRARAAFEHYPIRAVALDATVAARAQNGYRPVEMVFSRGRFQKHCKPGSTGSKVGQNLHAAGMAMISALDGVAAYAGLLALATFEEIPILEVFPTAALGVVMPDGRVGGVRRSKKSDAFFDLLWTEHAGRLGGITLDPALRVKNHDQRMAVIAAALAALYIERRYAVIGEDASGYFLMPHLDDWLSEWRDELTLNASRTPAVTIWSPEVSGAI